MNTIKSGLINWKTTIISSLLAVLLLMQETTDLTNWREWVLPAIIQVLGILMRDADKSSENSGITPMLLLGLCSVFFLPSCTPTAYIVDTTPYSKQIEASPDAVTMKPEHVTEVGGFQIEAGASVKTDQGEIDISNSGVSGNVVIDLRSGK